jgi:mannose-6-phosphate isomerase-like protein (cupin superfamily)
VASLWVTEKAPADFSWADDRSAARKSFAPSNGGTFLLIVDFPPVGPEVDKLDVNTMMNVVGADAPKRGVPPSNPLMHRTRTVDYAIVMSGEIDMVLDTGTVHLKSGDVVVQQATNHAWLNHGKEPCRIAFVLMDSQEP